MISLRLSVNSWGRKNSSSALRLPADSTSASRTDGLGIIDDPERAADELGSEIDHGAAQGLERYYVYNDVSLSHGRGLKHTLAPLLGLWW